MWLPLWIVDIALPYLSIGLGEAVKWQPFEGSIVKQGTHLPDSFSSASEAIIVKLTKPINYEILSYEYVELLPHQENNSFEDLNNAETEIECDSVRISRNLISSDLSFDLSWWRGGGVFVCLFELV